MTFACSRAVHVEDVVVALTDARLVSEELTPGPLVRSMA